MLVRAPDLTYQGYFTVPTLSGDGLDYGGHAMTYYEANDSLILAGHVNVNLTCEISVVGVGQVASTIQDVADAWEGNIDSIGTGSKRIGGNLVHNGTLYQTAFLFYDASGEQTNSHISRPIDLSDTGSVVGPTQVYTGVNEPDNAGSYSGYMCPVPAAWQDCFWGAVFDGECRYPDCKPHVLWPGRICL